MRELTVELSNNSYDIFINNNIIDNAGSYIKNIYKNKEVYILTDVRVKELYLDRLIKGLEGFNVHSVVIEGYEKAKSIKVYEEVCNELISLGIKRNHLLIALGGGVIGDLCGFVSATLYRGIPFVQIPTSLLAQMDSSIGGKVGINLEIGKNLLGAFNQPKLVLVDPLVLNTLPKKEFASGMGELIKHAFIGNPQILDMLDGTINEDIVCESLKVKKRVVENDEFDMGERMILNFGHTFGHAIEKKAGYGFYTHGEAVALGMLMAIRLGIKLGITKPYIYDKLKEVLVKYDMANDDLDLKEYMYLLKYDKKNIAGTLHFILLEDMGKPIIYKVKDTEVEELCK